MVIKETQIFSNIQLIVDDLWFTKDCSGKADFEQ